MKKLAVLAVAAMLVVGFAGQAAAFFEDLHLIRSIYTTTGNVEVGTDLGLDVSTFSLASPVNEQRNPDVALSAFDGGLSTLVVGYWAHNQGVGTVEPGRDFYATGNYMDGDGLTMLGRKQSTADGIYNSVQGLYDDSPSNTAIVNPKNTTGLSSYFNKFDSGGGVNSGGMGANLRGDSFEMTLSLAALATAGYVDQYLYYFDYDGTSTDNAGVEVAVIRTFLTSDGSTINLAGDKIATVINPSAVPIPGSVLLLASGLLGLFGFRRKRS